MKRLAINKAGRIAAGVIALAALIGSAAASVTAQVRPIYDRGVMGTAQLLRRVNTTASVLMIGAHPDDEDSALLAYLARGENARTAYLSLTRGDGGQNIIGPELFEALGVIRTEELLQARRLDGAEQYFARAFDYGFSKTLAEAKSKWDEKALLCDSVKVIRTFRPLVVISRFSGTPADGHGQHQFAGYIAPLAVAAASDPSQCAEAGAPWKPLKFYFGQGFNSTVQPTLRINTGLYDAVLGRTYSEIAIEGRSMHRSQGEGRIEFRGEQFSGLNLVGAEKDKRETSIFEGIDTSISGIAKLSNDAGQNFRQKLDDLQRKAAEARDKQLAASPQSTVASFADIVKGARSAAAETRSPAATQMLDRIVAWAVDGIQTAAGVQIDALAERETISPGETLPISVRTYFPAGASITVKEVRLKENCQGLDWGGCGVVTFATATETQPGSPGGRRDAARDARFFTASLNASLRYETQPYWLRTPRRGDQFEWKKGSVRQDEDTLPFSPPIVTAEVTVEIAGVEFTISRGIEYRYADPARGEIRRELNIVPAVTLRLDKDVLIVPQSPKAQTRRIMVTVTNNSTKPSSGSVGLGVGEWKVSPQTAEFNLTRPGESSSIAFDITIPAGTRPEALGYQISARILRVPASTQPDYTMHTVSYPHIQTHRYYTLPTADLRVVDFDVAPVRVGYIMGSGDDVPEALRQMGLNVTLLDDADIASADLSRFDTIVVGVRASETRPALASNFKRLMAYMTAGGSVIMQYQRGGFAQSGLTPFPVTTAETQRTAAGSIARVADENAPVRILEPGHPVFNTPNKITNADFEGWVQERNAYNLVTFDPQYMPLLESHDVGEQENKGGLVIARVGKGSYTYSSYSFFRQLPAGVGGAYRLFANLASFNPGRAK